MDELIKRARELAEGTWISNYDCRWPIKTVPEIAKVLEKLAEELERVYKDTCRKGAALKSKSNLPPMFISGDGLPDEVLMLQNAAVSQLSEGAESRWGADYPALARAAYEAGWDDAMMYYDQYGSSHDRE